MKKKHKITLLVIGILLALSLMLSSSYALWVFNVSQESTNVVQADCFEITYTDNNPIGLGASFPMRDSDGVKTTPYTFTIRNICNHPADFQINLETLNTSTIDESFIKADLNGRITEYNAAESVEPTIDGAISAAMLYEDTLAANGEKTYNLRVWVNEIATQEDVENKSYASKISVKATVRKQYAEGTLISGSDFNAALKKLADGGNTDCYESNSSIISIEWSENVPEESDNAINIAAIGTTSPIYAWFKDGIIYINSELDKIYLNQDSSNMFYKMEGVTSIDLSHFDTSKVVDMGFMFSYNSALESLDLSSFDTSNVTNMYYMFSNSSNITSINLSSFDTSNVINMRTMFYYLNKLTTLDVSNFNTSKVTNMNEMFMGMEKLTNLDVSHFDTSNVTDMSSMFKGLENIVNLDVSNFDTSNVTTMNSMFSNLKKMVNLDVSNFDTSNVTSMSSMFSGSGKIVNLDLSNFDTSNVRGMSNMFDGMSNLTNLDLSHFNTSNVKYMDGMFEGMSSLTNLDLSNFDTSNVTTMLRMFLGMTNIKSLDLSKFNTSKVTSMGYMFSAMYSLEDLNLSSFDTSNVTYMSHMFSNLKNLKVLDLSSFNTSKVKNMDSMFEVSYNIVSNLETIYVGNEWNVGSVTSSSYMFNYLNKLVGGSGTVYTYPNIGISYAHVDGGATNPGYFTLKTS